MTVTRGKKTSSFHLLPLFLSPLFFTAEVSLFPIKWHSGSQLLCVRQTYRQTARQTPGSETSPPSVAAKPSNCQACDMTQQQVLSDSHGLFTTHRRVGPSASRESFVCTREKGFAAYSEIFTRTFCSNKCSCYDLLNVMRITKENNLVLSRKVHFCTLVYLLTLSS